MHITGDKLLCHLDRLTGDRHPVTADIFLTNYCNNKCPYCTYRRWDLSHCIRSVPYDDFVRYATRLSVLGVRGFILTGGGEPTICNDFDRITQWLERQGCHYGINTNFNQYRECRPDYLKVSLDGWDEDSYAASRGVQAYGKTRRNIQRYADWKAANSPGTALGIQIAAATTDAVERFYAANNDLPVDYIVCRPMESTGGEYYKTKQHQEDAAAILQTVRELSKADSRVTLNYKWKQLSDRPETCAAAWAQIAVDEWGNVMYCCHKPYEIVGHVMDTDILAKKAAYCTDMNKCDIPCRLSAPNRIAAQLEEIRETTKDPYFI